MTTEAHVPSVLSDESWWLGNVGLGARFKHGPSRIVRRATFSCCNIVIDDDDEMIVVVALSEGYSALSSIDGRQERSSPRIGLISFFTPGQLVKLNIIGPARYLTLNLSLSRLRLYLASHFELYEDRVIFQSIFRRQDADFERLFYRLATVEDEALCEIVCEAIGCLLARYTAPTAYQLFPRRKAGLSPKRLGNVCDRIESELTTRLPLSLLAETAQVSAFHFAREFHAMTGLSPHQYIIRRRIDRALRLLAQPDISIEQVSHQSGFNRASHLSRHMRRLIGVTPRVFRSKVLL